MQIAPPFGYTEVVPFQKTQKVRLPAPGSIPPFIERSNAVPISYAEFQVVAREYPIVFAGEAGKPAAAVAVLGLTRGENLYARAGAWQAGSYVPAYVRRYPFCMARLPKAPARQASHVICVERAFVDENGGEALFDAAGKPLARWGELERLLSEYEADLGRTREMCDMLADYGLLEPFTMQATLAKEKGGASMQLTGMQRVAEKKLENLNAAQLRNLVRTGVMARLYVHLLSLENFARLLERKAAGAPA